MNNTMNYKGYTARVEFDPRDEIFIGRVLGIEDRITFHGETVAKLRTDFHAAIDHYLADCAAEAQGKSLNQWAAEVLARAS
jgi:predicted HicB family RNase H-like nuclease